MNIAFGFLAATVSTVLPVSRCHRRMRRRIDVETAARPLPNTVRDMFWVVVAPCVAPSARGGVLREPGNRAFSISERFPGVMLERASQRGEARVR